jgi:VWFA-related protein
MMQRFTQNSYHPYRPRRKDLPILYFRSAIVASLCICSIAPFTPAYAQEIPGIPASTIRVQSQLVVLDVVVTDEKGNVVTDLRREDFSVYENGVAQEVQDFEGPAQNGAGLLSLPEAAPRDKNGNANWGDAPLTILVIDALNTPFEETAYSRYEVARYLKAQPALLKKPTIALWLNDGGFHAISEFTRDRNALISVVDNHKGSLPDKMTRGAMVEQLSSSLSALQQIALFSRGNKGSKEIIWVGRSFPGVDETVLGSAQQDVLKSAVSSTIDLLMKSRATIYVIDPTSNLNPPASLVSAIPSPQAVSAYSSVDPFAKAFSFMSFVEQTGGKYYVGHNDMDNEIERSVDQGTQFYTLSYVPSEPIRDDKYRKIDIRLMNPKLRIQAKSGYYPEPSGQRVAGTRALEFDLREALVTDMAYTGVGLRVESCNVDPGRRSASCDVIVDNNSLSFDSDSADGSKRTMIVAAIGALDEKSKILSSSVSKLGIGIPPNHAKQDDLGRTKLTLHIALAPKVASIRAVVRDDSGRIGTANLASQIVRRLTAGSTK